VVGEAVESTGGTQAVQLRVAEQYVGAFTAMAKAGTTMIVPANTADIASMVTTAMAAFKAHTPPARAQAQPQSQPNIFSDTEHDVAPSDAQQARQQAAQANLDSAREDPALTNDELGKLQAMLKDK